MLYRYMSLIISIFLIYYSMIFAHQEEAVSWVFSPGIHSEGIEQLSKYVVTGYVESHHGLAYTSRSLEVIDPCSVSYVTYAEIASPEERYFNPLSFLYNRIIKAQNERTNHERDVKHTVNFSIDLSKINFGQELDIACLQETFNAHQKRYSSPIILYGASRGAACLFNACALQAIPLDQVKGVVLEGCYDAVEQIITKTKLPINVFLANFVRRCFSAIYRGYDVHGPKPINLIAQYPKDVPTLFITSEKDAIVPMNSTIRIFQALKDAGHKNVYLLVLKNSPHREYMRNPEDRNRYQKAVHAFYKICGISHNALLAREGIQFLETEFSSLIKYGTTKFNQDRSSIPIC